MFAHQKHRRCRSPNGPRRDCLIVIGSLAESGYYERSHCRPSCQSTPQGSTREIVVSSIIWIIVIGFIAGFIARFLLPGPNDPKGFVLTTVLGIASAFLATFIGRAVGFIGATVGAVPVLFIWNRLVAHRVIADPGNPGGPSQPPSRRL
jgi:uncharacterized membrane protein YeaQ/YmgE (transglycosylase-associated protein family)